jgi:hypothetical protein
MKGPRFQRVATESTPIDDQLSNQRPDIVVLVDVTTVGLEFDEEPFQKLWQLTNG